MFNKRGQVGETVTWLIGTLVIIVILFVSIFIVQFYASRKGKIYETSIADDLAKKSFLSYLLTNGSDGKIIYEQLRDEENLNNYSGDLAKNIFKNFYANDYSVAIWVGILDHRNDDKEGVLANSGLENAFFGEKPSSARTAGIFYASALYDFEKIKLDENKEVELILMEQ